MSELETRIRQLLEAVPGGEENKRLKLSDKTFEEYFGPRHREEYSDEFVELVRHIPIAIDNAIPDGEVYCFYCELEPPGTYECEECGERIDEPGLCVFCFATASIG